MGDAHYLHAALYRFTTEASKALISEYKNTLQNVSARCSYDREHHVFTLACPSTIGGHANDVLSALIKKYIGREHANAGRNDGDDVHTPELARFRETLLTRADFSHTAEQAHLTEPTNSSSPIRHTFVPIILHAVAGEGVKLMTVKLFRLRELPQNLVKRVLAFDNAKAKRTVGHGLTCRSAIWNNGQDKFCFNGRVGEAAQVTRSASHARFELTVFGAIMDRRTHMQATPKAAIRQAPDDRDSSSILDFLPGPYQGAYLDPNEGPKAPDDAKDFLGGVDHELKLVTRPRIARRDAELSDSLEELDRERGQSEGTPDASDARGGLFALLKARHQSNGRPSIVLPKEVVEESSSNNNNNNNNNNSSSSNNNTCRASVVLFQDLVRPTVPTFSNAVRGLVPPGRTLQSSTTSLLQKQRSPWQPNHEAESSCSPSHSRSRLTATTLCEEFPSLEHSGLVKRSMRKPTGIAPRVTHDPAEAMVAPSGYDSSRLENELRLSDGISSRLASSQASSKVRTPASTRSASPQYTEKERTQMQYQRGTPEGELIDISAAEKEVPAFLKPPPGFELRSTPNSMSSLPARRGSGPLPSAPTLHICPQPSEKARQTVQTPDLVDDEVIERLQKSTEHENVRKYTINQKAKKKGARKGHKQSSSKSMKARLPMPDPVPPPKVKQEPATPVSDVDSEASPNRPSEFSSSTSTITPIQTTLDEEELNTAQFSTVLERLADEVYKAADVEEAFIEANFGLLVLDDDGDLGECVSSPHTLETKLNTVSSSVKVNFLPRLSTSDGDALYMLDMVTGNEEEGSIIYEITIKTFEGELISVALPQDDIRWRSAETMRKLLGTSYLHYPVRVWDVQATIRGCIKADNARFDDAMMKAVDEFLMSIQTVDPAPSFQADLSSALFSVERVTVTRRFTRPCPGGFELRVSEVQDLMLRAIQAPNYNLAAMALPRDEMVAACRLWWECSLHAKIDNSLSFAALQETVDRMISQMDGVGYANVGPWARDETPDGSVASGQSS